MLLEMDYQSDKVATNIVYIITTVIRDQVK